MLDIVMLSFDEPNANENWNKLKSRFSHAKRVHGVKGIAEAHIAASKRANTTFFYVVDGDSEVLDTFNFDYRPGQFEAEFVHIWNAKNPAIDQTYGYGGVKLFSKKFFKEIKNQVDFSTTLSRDVKFMDEVASITHFNSDALRAYRGAFRESAKLSSIIRNRKSSQDMKNDAEKRLVHWLSPNERSNYREQIIAGAEAGSNLANEMSEDLAKINDYEYLLNRFSERFPDLDFRHDPTPPKNNPMRGEMFFTARIASALYDPYVLDHLPLSELRDALSDGQLLSKVWLTAELGKLIRDKKIKPNEDGKIKVIIVGSWIGTLALMLNAWELPLSITNFDLDERANRIAEKLNYDYDFITHQGDMFDVDYSEFDVIINTASEHIPSIPEWRNEIPKGKVIIVQNTDFEEGTGHISVIGSSSQLLDLLDLDEVYYEGTKRFSQYARFMAIGRT